MLHGVTLPAIAALGYKEVEVRPQPTIRTAKALIVNIFTQEELLPEAVRQRRFPPEAASGSSPEIETVAVELKALATVKDVQAYAEACHQAAMNTFKAMSEEDLNRPVESPFGTYPAWRFFDFAYD